MTLNLCLHGKISSLIVLTLVYNFKNLFSIYVFFVVQYMTYFLILDQLIHCRKHLNFLLEFYASFLFCLCLFL